MDTHFCLQVCTAFAKKEWSQELHFFREKETLLPLVWTQAPPPFLPCIDVYSLGVICGHLHILCHLFTQSLTFTLTYLWLIDLNTSVQAACFLKLIIPCLSWLLGESLHSQCVSHTHTKVKKKERYRQSQWQTRDLYSLLLLLGREFGEKGKGWLQHRKTRFLLPHSIR